MFNPKANSATPTVSFGLHSIGLRVCLLWFAITAVVLALSVALITQSFGDQRRMQAMQWVNQEAMTIRASSHPTAQNKPLTSNGLPSFHHVGTYFSATSSANWPTGCDLKNEAPAYDTPFSASCKTGSHLIGVRLKMSPSISNSEDLLVWTILESPELQLTPSASSLVAAIVLVSALSIFGSRALTHSLTKHLGQINQGIVKISEGDYQYRITASKLSEIDSVIEAFNSMGQVIEERDRFFKTTAFVDSLSGLDNKAFLLYSLKNRVQQAAEPLCILTWSVGNLSEIYDALGQEIVDQLLRKIAKKARRVCPAYLSLARLEGNAFAVVLPANLFNALPLPTFKRLMHCKISVGQQSFDIQGHAGLALYPTHGTEADTLLRRSEVARQMAEKQNTSLVHFEPKMEKKSAVRLAMIAELRKAIAEKEFELFLQPKLNLKSGQVTQAEALIRWNHPSRGLMAPGAFIGLAEQTGLIKNLSRWVLSKCYDIALRMHQHHIGISVNISAQDLDDNTLLEHARALHKKNPYVTQLITLEVTESCTINDPEQACELLTQFAKLGFRISVDDFGSGYSSLAYLKRFPVSELKIDRSLIQNADRDTDASIIVQSTIEMGHTMGLLVTAEGVETEGEYLLTSSLGADFIQGYYLSPAVPESVFFARFTSVDYDQVTQPV